MKLKRILGIFGMVICMVVTGAVLHAYIYSYFFLDTGTFCRDFNRYGEAIPEMIMFFIAIIGLVILLIEEWKK